MTLLMFRKTENVTKLLMIVFIICAIVSGLFTAVPVYETPAVSVITEQIPEYELSITNDTWIPTERILLANLTPKLEDPSWYSSESSQRYYDARIETVNSSTTHYFYNHTAVNETYTWNEFAEWGLIWPFAVLNYTELTAVWHIRVLRGNITVDSSFQIGRGFTWQSIRGSYVTDSISEMNASAGEEITLVATASNFTEQFSTIDVGVLWVDLDILAAQGSIVVVDNVEVWISTDEPLCSVTLDFQSLYGQSLLSNPSIISQWLGTAYAFSYNDIGDRLSFYLKSISPSLPYGYDLMLVTRSNQTAYLSPGNYSLTLGWSDMYLNDEYLFDLILYENSSYSMLIPLPFNPISFEMSNDQVPGTVHVSFGSQWIIEYFDRMNITESEEVLMILPECTAISLQLSIPREYWVFEVQLTEGARSKIIIDLKLIPVFGVCFTPQQVTSIVLASIFTVLSLLMLLYRWHTSKDTSYFTLVPLLLFVMGFVLPWYTRTDVISGVEYSTYFSPILGYRLWHLDSLYLTVDFMLSSDLYLHSLFPSMIVVYLLSFLLAFFLFEAKAIEFLFACSIGILVGGVIPFFTLGGVPWLGFWCMMAVPFLAYFIRFRSKRDIDEIPLVDKPKPQSD